VELTRRAERHQFAFRLEANATPETSVETFCRDDGAGGTVEVTEIFSFADGSGAAVLDGRPVSQDFGSLQHFEQLVGGSC
jgi:hypothetical protein